MLFLLIHPLFFLAYYVFKNAAVIIYNLNYLILFFKFKFRVKLQNLVKIYIFIFLIIKNNFSI